jgi:hypothetical protein
MAVSSADRLVIYNAALLRLAATGATNGAGDASAYPDQVFLAPHLGLLLVGGLAEPSPDARAAARIAIDAVRAQVERHQDAVQRASLDPSPSSRDRLLDLLDEGMQRAAQELYAFGRRRPVAISLDVLLVTPRQAFVAHVGAGRVYLLRRGLVHQLTVDPSAPADTGEVFDLSGIGRTDAGDGGGRRFSRALGRHPQVVAERLCIEVSPDDRFVLAAEDLVRAWPESLLHAHLLGAPVDGLDYVFRRAWVGEDPPANTYELIPMEQPMVGSGAGSGTGAGAAAEGGGQK